MSKKIEIFLPQEERENVELYSALGDTLEQLGYGSEASEVPDNASALSEIEVTSLKSIIIISDDLFDPSEKFQDGDLIIIPVRS